LCPQSLCGSAFFSGSFLGTSDNEPIVGSFSTAVDHQSPLPKTRGESVLITGGTWLVWSNRGTFSGNIEQGGKITANGNNTFAISATLELSHGGSGFTSVSGTLNHNVFPPTVMGIISQ
jgi:hypothetical protein